MIGNQAKLLSVAVLILSGCEPNTAADSSVTDSLQEIITYPESISVNCRGGKARIYDECSDQLELFHQALRRSEQEGKVLLVSYGAEWCIWCHVFAAYVKGQTDRFTYTYGDPETEEMWTDTLKEKAKRDVGAEAIELSKFVSDNFVLAHIEYRYAPNGDKILLETNAIDAYNNTIPFVFTVNREGQFAATYNHDDVQVRREGWDWYRGYDRQKLLAELKKMHAAASR